MTQRFTRRTLLRTSGLALGGSLAMPVKRIAAEEALPVMASQPAIARLCFNENPYGPSPSVAAALQGEFGRLNRYADAAGAQSFVEQVAEYEQVPVDQVVPGEILGLLGINLGSQGGPGGEFLYSTPGYLALVDAAARVGGVGVPVPLNARYENDLPALAAKVNSKTRAVYLVNPHNPTGTVSENAAFQSFLRRVSPQAVVIVDEAYLEYTPDFEARSAASLVREGANVMVFRTFDKIHGLAGLPIGYVLAPRSLAAALRKEGAGDAESLGRLNLVAASAALGDRHQVERTRKLVTEQREQWIGVLEELKLAHTDSHANFVFFDARRPQGELAAALRSHGIEIGRAHPPFTTWARITIGLPEENLRAQTALRKVLS